MRLTLNQSGVDKVHDNPSSKRVAVVRIGCSRPLRYRVLVSVGEHDQLETCTPCVRSKGMSSRSLRTLKFNVKTDL